MKGIMALVASPNGPGDVFVCAWCLCTFVVDGTYVGAFLQDGEIPISFRARRGALAVCMLQVSGALIPAHHPPWSRRPIRERCLVQDRSVLCGESFASQLLCAGA